MKTKAMKKRFLAAVVCVATLFAMVLGSVSIKPVEVKAAVTNVTLSKTSLTLEVDSEKTEKLSATVTVTDGEDETVTWQSSSEDVASVNEEGVVRAGSKAGTATITATSKADNTKEAVCVVTVNPKVKSVDDIFVAAGEAYSKAFEACGADTYSWTITPTPGLNSTRFVIDNVAGKIIGNPTADDKGEYTIKITATTTIDGNNYTSAEVSYKLTVTAVSPTITTTSIPDGTKGVAYEEYQLTATGSQPIIWSAPDGCPAGMILSSDGKLSGTPTSGGEYKMFKIMAANNAGDHVKVIPFNVNAIPEITTLTLPDAKVGNEYKKEIIFTGYPAVNITANGLPASLKMTLEDGKWYIKGEPTAAEAKDTAYNVELEPKNSKGTGTKVSYSLFVKKELVSSIALDPPSKTIAVKETLPLTATVLPNEASVKTLEWTSSHPDIARVDENGKVTGLKASGTPVTITAKATDGSNKQGTAQITVSATKPLITTDKDLPIAIKEQSYSGVQLKADAPGTLSWTLVSGVLPTGLTLSTNGTVSGTATAEKKDYTFTAKVSNGTEDDTKEFTISVVETSVNKDGVKNDSLFKKDKIVINQAGLNAFAEAQHDIKENAGKTITVSVILEDLNPTGTTNDQKKLIEEAQKVFAGVEKKYISMHYIEATAKALIDGTSKEIHDTGAVQTITISDFSPSSFNEPLLVFHLDEGDVIPFSSGGTTPKDTTYYHNNTAKTLYIHSRYFSPFAIVYSEKPTVRIDFDSQGGTDVDSVYVQEKGAIIRMPNDPTKDDHTFEGWYLEKDLKTKVTSSTKFDGDHKLYAKWTSSNDKEEEKNEDKDKEKIPTRTTDPTQSGGRQLKDLPPTGDRMTALWSVIIFILVLNGAYIALAARKGKRE